MKGLPKIVPAETAEAQARGELTQLAIKLREDLRTWEEQPGGRQDFAQVVNSASALILAIIEPEQALLPASPPKKAAQGIPYPGGKRSIPISHH